MNTTQGVMTLEARKREQTGKAVQKLRQQGNIPAVLYGRGIENKNISIDYKAFEDVYKAAGGSRLIDLTVDSSKPTKVLVQKVQRDPVSGDFVHIDFYQVNMKEKITAEVTVVYVGESKAVKEAGGILIKNADTLKIECLPNDLIDKITVDISSLQTFDDVIRIKDLQLPSGIVIKALPEKVVASVQPPRTEEELKELEEKPEDSVEEVEVAGEKGKEEGEETTEGEKEQEGKPSAESAKEEKK